MHKTVAKSQCTIKARVFSGPNGTGELLADLGAIAGGELDHAEKKAQAKVTERTLAVRHYRKALFQAVKNGVPKDEVAGIKFVLKGLEQEVIDAKSEYRIAAQALKAEKDEQKTKLRFLKERREGASNG